MLIDNLEIKYSINKKHKNENGDITLFSIINEESFLPSLVLNLFELERSLIEVGDDFSLFLCTCGDAECGGVTECQTISHLEENIIIRFKSPIIRTIVLSKDNIIEQIDTLRNKLFRERNINEYKYIEVFAYEPIYDWLMD